MWIMLDVSQLVMIYFVKRITLIGVEYKAVLEGRFRIRSVQKTEQLHTLRPWLSSTHTQSVEDLKGKEVWRPQEPL